MIQQSNHKKRSKLLPTAAWQHLRRGGYEYEEIIRMVPDQLGNLGAAGRVATRVREPNACSVLPLHMAGKVRKDKRGKRKSPSGEN